VRESPAKRGPAFADRGRGGAFSSRRGRETSNVTVDPEALRQVLTNLLATPCDTRHPAPITVSLEPAPDGVTVSVADTGSGICPGAPATHLRALLPRRSGRSRGRGRHGLGLAIVKHLVEAHGGRVEHTAAWAAGQRPSGCTSRGRVAAIGRYQSVTSRHRGLTPGASSWHAASVVSDTYIPRSRG